MAWHFRQDHNGNPTFVICVVVWCEWILNSGFTDLDENTTWLLDSVVLPTLSSCYSHKPGFVFKEVEMKIADGSHINPKLLGLKSR